MRLASTAVLTSLPVTRTATPALRIFAEHLVNFVVAL